MAKATGSRMVSPSAGTNNLITSSFITLESTFVQAGGDFLVSDKTVPSLATSKAYIQNNTNNTGNALDNPLGKAYINGVNSANVNKTIDGYGLPLGELSGTPDRNGNATLYSTQGERELAQAYFQGGVGIEQDLAVGGYIYGRIAFANTASTATNITVLPVNNNKTYYPVFTDQNGLSQVGAQLYGDQTSNYPDGGLTYNPYTGQLSTDKGYIAATDNAVSTTTGAFTVTGGVGIGQDIYIGGDVLPGNTEDTPVGVPSSIGNTNTAWATAYLQNIYTKFLGNSSGNINIAPNNGINYPDGGNGGTVDIFGQIRVRGQNPIGTAPVVTNILYVTMDGDDTNDGRAMDPSRACRTVSGAVKSPYYQSGTQIRVAPGHYLEDNPILLKPYTSVMGSDIRTTEIEPINKTQDLFHVQSGCYLAFMQFCQGRSGLLPGNAYINGTNRGAYCTAFPPLPAGEEIDLFHSPYIQNCTNLSGPWLMDGSLFFPDQTIQIPVAVGTGTWVANTTSIVISAENVPINGFIYAGSPGSNATQYTGSLSTSTSSKGYIPTASQLATLTNVTLLSAYTATDTGAVWVYTGAQGLELGMSVSSGQQNPGFFNARTLLLANKPFLQSQIVYYIETLFNSGTPYSNPNPVSCTRDTGLIVDVIGQDLLYGTSSDSTFAGLQYWSQDLGFTGSISSEITATKNAISYLGTLVANTATHNVSTVTSLFNVITNILNNGPTGITNSVQVYSTSTGGLPTTNPDTLADIAALQANRSSMQQKVVDHIWNGGFTSFNSSTCYRDVGYIIDSICTDLSTGGNLQSIKSGVYYYAYDNGNSVLQGTNDTLATTAAYSYIQSIIPSIVAGTLITTPYQTAVKQVVTTTPGTSEEINILQSNVAVITSIIQDGPSVASPKTPQSLVLAPDTNAVNAWNALYVNRAFIVAEVNAYIASVFSGTFNYNQQLSYRDVGILIENVAYDAAFGGNEKAVEAGNAYWNGVVSYIATELPQCIAAVNYLSDLAQSVILNQPCPVITPPPTASTIPVASQVINTVLVGGDIAGPSIKNGFSTIIDIMKNGPSFAPTVYKSTGPDAAFASAEILLQANRQFIQEQTINYINWNLVQPQSATYLPYNKVKCERDTGLIIDGIASDLLFPTPKYSQTTFAGLQYYNQGAYTGNISSEITTTTAAISYLQTLATKIVTNVTASDDAIVGITRYTTGTQITNIEPGSATEVAKINNEFAIILSILKGNTAGWTDQIVSNGGTASTLKSVQDSYSLLQANKLYLQDEVYTYVTTGTVHGGLGFTNFTTATCKRDVGYIIDSISFDLLYGGNRQAIQSGLSYYTQNGSSVVIPQETSATVAAFTFLGNVIGTLVTSPSTYTPYQTAVAPVTSLPLSDNVVSAKVTSIVSTLTNIIGNGPAGYEFTPISLTLTTSTDFTNAYNIIEANRSFLVAETLAWLDNRYNSTATFVYNEATCGRDTGLIVDAIGMDMLYSSVSDSTFAGLQYWSQGNYTGNINSEVTAVLSATNYLSGLVAATALGVSNSSISGIVTSLFNTVTNIIANGVTGITDQVSFGSLPSSDSNYVAAYNAIQANRTTYQTQVLSYLYTNYPSLSYSTSTCYRDVGYIVDSVSFDLLHGGNIQSIKSGVYYYGYNNDTQVPAEVPQTLAAYNFIGKLVQNIVTNNKILTTYQTAVAQQFGGGFTAATKTEAQQLQQKIDIINNIILNGPSAAGPKTPQSLTLSYDINAQHAWTLLHANRNFIVAEVLAFLNATTSTAPFAYNQDLCYRDTGLMVDAVSQDILLGGNARSVEAGLAYWNQGYNYVATELTTITQAISYISAISQKIIANKPVSVVTGTVSKQVINPFYQYGGDYMPQEAVARNYGIISTIIDKGPEYAPPIYQGGGLFAATGMNALDVKISPTVTFIETLSTGTYLVGLSEPTVGFGNNATLYFGNTYVWPLQTYQVEQLSLKQTGSTSTWDQRKVDPIGGMGGSLVDGAVISARSPIQSFVYDAFTQLTQGGRGVRITNNGYAQLVSVFTIFGSVGVQVDNGGIASIVNSNANFGDLCLVAKGYGTRKFSGTVYNPANRSYPFSPASLYGVDGLDQYYPNGYWPDNRGNVAVFVPDTVNRPHISLVMEVVPPASYSSAYNSPQLAANGVVLEGFLNARPSTGTLVAGSIDLVNIDTTNVYIGNNVYVLDQFGYPFDNFQYKHDDFGNYLGPTGSVLNTQTSAAAAIYGVANPAYGIPYCQTGTTVVDVNYNAITLNKALTSGGSFPNDNNYFTIYFTGNTYYTVQTSQTIPDSYFPYQLNKNILSTNTNALFQGPTTNQIAQHAAAIRYLNTLTDYIINNDTSHSGTYYQNTVTQVTNLSFGGAGSTQSFIDLRFKYLTTILTATNLNSALSVVPSADITQTGTIPSGAGSAVGLIKANLDFLGAEIYAFVQTQYPGLLNGSSATDQQYKCYRDVALIMQQLIYDLETGGNYNMVYSGLSYWARSGTYHIVELGEVVTDPSLFPDGATVNFYQRSYISASGYVFEYVGAGTNYGALPQNGIADPVQGHETVQLDSGKVFFTSTDQNGDFRIGPELVISQATGVISGRTFTQSLFANMTPFILAIEGI